MRLFTAIELDDAARTAVANLSGEVQRRVAQSAPRARLTWVTADRMHFTLRFIGEVDDAVGARILGALRDPLPMAPFTITLGGLGAFPPKGAPRVVWLGVDRGRDEMVSAEAMVSDRLRALGIEREDRAYSPHLTLGRVREPGGLKPSTLFEGLSVTSGAIRVDAITLFQSKLSPKGPTYAVLERTALRDG